MVRIIVAAVLFAAGGLLHLEGWAELGVYLVCYAVIGWDIVWKAITNILHGQVFDENFLMTIATVGALILGEHSEGVAVMLFYQVGEWFQSYAVSKSRRSITSLMDIRPDYANIEKDGKLIQVDPEDVKIGDTIIVKPGERVPLDGKIIKGSSTLDTSALTGESMPREVEAGMEVISGCINQTGILTIQTTKEFGESTVAKILDLVENASDKKGRMENFITRFARYYTPVVVFAALALAVLPPLVTGQAFSIWIYRALTFLVISCPCALVISIPLSFFGGIGGASKIGVLVKGSNYLEALAYTETVVFDKTGTLTKGSFAVTEIHANGMEDEELLELAEKTRREFQSREELTGEIAIGCGETCNMAYLSDWMMSFRREHPLVQFRIRTATADDVKERIENGLLDMGLLVEPADTPDYESVRMPSKERWGALVRADSPLAAEAVSPKDLLSQPLLLPTRESVHSQLMGWFGEDYPAAQVAARFDFTFNAAIMVKHHMGIALCHDKGTAFFPSLRMVPLSPTLESGALLVWRKGIPRSRAVEQFITHIRELS